MVDEAVVVETLEYVNQCTNELKEMLDEFKYLRGVPVLRAVHENTLESERIRRHEGSPRPDLPTAVADALDFDEAAEAVDVPDDDEFESTFADEATEDEAGTFSDPF